MQTKVKGLAPSLKEKKRYINIEIISPEGTSVKKDAYKKAELKAQELLGVFDAAGAGIQLVEHSEKHGIIRVNNDYTDKTKAALMLIREINGSKIIIKTTNTSGTLRKAREKISR